MSLDSFSTSELQAIQGTLSETDPNKFSNKEDVELQWAMKAYQHAETYFNLICSVDPKFLKLTQLDDEIYTVFRQDFPDLQVDVLNEAEMKTDLKEKWRLFCSKFENKVKDFNFGTLIRLNSQEAFTETNSMFVVRIQFLAIEIARNREGYNNGLSRKFKSPSS